MTSLPSRPRLSHKRLVAILEKGDTVLTTYDGAGAYHRLVKDGRYITSGLFAGLRPLLKERDPGLLEGSPQTWELKQ